MGRNGFQLSTYGHIVAKKGSYSVLKDFYMLDFLIFAKIIAPSLVSATFKHGIFGSGQSRKRGMNNRPGPGMAENTLVNALGGTNSEESDSKAASRKTGGCLYCHKRFAVAMPKQKFCSSRCRLLFWAIGEIIKDLGSGKVKEVSEIIGRPGT
jgi:hypothetical protein